MIKLFGDYIPNIGDIFETNIEIDSGLTYEIIPSINLKYIRFKRSDGGVGNWNQQKFNEYVNSKRLILKQ